MQVPPSLPSELWMLIVAIVGIVGTVVGAVVGSVITYLGQSKLDERNYRRRRRELFNQELLGPLNAEIDYITKKVKDGALPHSEENKIATVELERLTRKYQFLSVSQALQSKVYEILEFMKYYEVYLDGAKILLSVIVRDSSLEILGKKALNLIFRVLIQDRCTKSVDLITAVLMNKPIDDLLAPTTVLVGTSRDAMTEDGKPIGYELGIKFCNKVTQITESDTNFHNFNVNRNAFLKILNETKKMIVNEMQIT